ADLGGLKIALAAFLHSKEGQAEVAAGTIDGLTAEQRFFVAYGQSFRSSQRDEELRLQILTNPHSPDKYRVIAPLANMPEFAKAFSCSGAQSPLRPEATRVNIW
ncbi:MAG TPA: M13-type metalloendopeptidase, partial [Burkholderiaceae bacterium]